MITAFLIAVTFLIGALALYITYLYGQIKGYEDGLEDSQKILREVYDEVANKTDAGTDL